MSSASLAIDIRRVDGAQITALSDAVAVEEPLEIRLSFHNGEKRTTQSISITMRTPGDDIDLATGFLFSEAIVRSKAEIATASHVGPSRQPDGLHNIVRVELSDETRVDIDKLQRNFYTTSSCGVCGKSSLDALRVIGLQSLADNSFSIARKTLVELPDSLRKRQGVFSQTGGLHAAAAFDSNGRLIVVREDVGRHNAVDKVIGYLLNNEQLPASNYGLLVSGRASFELMQKALVAGMPLLAAVGAPSSLAAQLAHEFGISLVGFLRGEQFNIYSRSDRITQA